MGNFWGQGRVQKLFWGLFIIKNKKSARKKDIVDSKQTLIRDYYRGMIKEKVKSTAEDDEDRVKQRRRDWKTSPN